MKSTIINWLVIIALTTVAYFGAHICASQYLKAKYPNVYRVEHEGGGIDAASLEQYRAKENSIMLGLLISSSIIASGAVVASQKK